MKLLTRQQCHIDRIKDLMWKQTQDHPLGMPRYFGTLNYRWSFTGDPLSSIALSRRYRANEVRKTHRFIKNLINKTFGNDVATWWFIERHRDHIDDEGNTVEGRFHTHFLVGDISDRAIENPNPYLMPLFYNEDESGIPINMRDADIDTLKYLLLGTTIRQSKWVGRHPKALKLDVIPPEEMETVFFYCLKDFNSNLEQMDIVIDWGNSSYYKP